jgi:hypothetical protein
VAEINEWLKYTEGSKKETKKGRKKEVKICCIKISDSSRHLSVLKPENSAILSFAPLQPTL